MAIEDLDPFGNYYFSLEIDGVELAHFLEFSGLKTSAEVYEIQEGGFNGGTHKRPGASSYENIILKYASSASTQLAEWRDRYMLDQFDTRAEGSAAIVVRSNAGDEVRRYTFNQLWPVSWEGPSLASGGSDLAVETLELAYDSLYVDSHEPDPPDPDPDPDPDPNEPLAVAPVPFEFDSDTMKPEGEEACDKLHESIKKQDPPPEKVWIDAHTCTMGSWGYNLNLSDLRAKATANEMQAKADSEGLNIKYLARGFSYRFPATSNATKGGREANRRSEFFTSAWEERGRGDKEPDNARTEPNPKPS